MIFKAIGFNEIKAYAKVAALVGTLIILLFIFANNFVLPILTMITILAAATIVAQFSLTYFFMFMVFVIPLAVNQKVFDSEVTLLMPSEPLEAIISLAFGIKILFGYKISPKIINHPIFLLMITCLLLQFAATLTSVTMMVSIKTMLLKSAYFIVFFVLCADMYLKHQMNHISILKTYTFSIVLVGIFIFINHLDAGLSKDSSGSVTEPFYADHTIYSACLAIILPLPLLTLYNSKRLKINFYQRFWIACLGFILLTFFFFTFCRAGWISFLIASIIIAAIYFGMRFKSLMILFFSTILMLFIYQSEIIEGIKQNKADSNAKNATLEQQTKSVTNITSDQSNAERLNRWSCAWRMFLDKPILGHGPGTYQFEYLSYQKKSEMTRISVTSPYNIKKGKGGTAHSEYLLLLSETGIISFLLFISSILMVFYYAIKVYSNTENINVKIRILIVFFGFCTYIMHGFFNNFLDTDKAALLYYTSIAAIMVEAIQLKQKENQQAI